MLKTDNEAMLSQAISLGRRSLDYRKISPLRLCEGYSELLLSWLKVKLKLCKACSNKEVKVRRKTFMLIEKAKRELNIARVRLFLRRLDDKSRNLQELRIKEERRKPDLVKTNKCNLV